MLLMAAGVYRERPVVATLQRYFSSAWFHHKPRGEASQTAVVPDACADLVWCSGNLLVAGPNRQVSFESVPPGTTVVGMRFHPGAVDAWLGVPASELLGARLPFDTFRRSNT